MKQSVVSSVFVNYTLEDTVDAIAAMGCAGIDIWAGRPHVYRRDYSQSQLLALRQRIEDRQLHVASLMPAFFRYPHSLSSPHDAIRQDSLDYMRQCLDNAVLLGADVLLIVPGRSMHGQSLADARQRLLDSIDTVCRAAQSYPIKLGIEPANTGVTDLVVTALDALNIIQTLGHKHLGIVMDTGHMHLNGEDLETTLDRLGDLLLQFHVNDNNGSQQQNAVPGTGTYDFARFVRVLKARGFGGFLSIELGWDYTRDPVPSVRQSLQHIHHLIDT